MTETKFFEVRDAGTFIPVMAVRLVAGDGEEDYLIRRAGFGKGMPYVLLTNLMTLESHYAPDCWDNTRTIRTAHRAIVAGWVGYPTGSVIDVEFLLGETAAPKTSERLECLGANL